MAWLASLTPEQIQMYAMIAFAVARIYLKLVPIQPGVPPTILQQIATLIALHIKPPAEVVATPAPLPPGNTVLLLQDAVTRLEAIHRQLPK